MTVLSLVLDGYMLAFTFFVAIAVLIAAAFLVGRMENLRRKGALEQSISALKQVIEEQQARLDNLRKENEGLHRAELRAKESVERWETIRRDHQNLDAMRAELETFEREESNRIDELERRRAEAARRLGEIQSALDAYPPEITGDEAAWTQALDQRRSEFDELKQATETARQERNNVEAQRIRAVDDVAQFESRRERLNRQIEAAQEALENIQKGQVETLKPYNERLLAEAGQLQRQTQELADQLRERQQALADAKEELAQAKQKIEAVAAASEAVGGAVIQFPDQSLDIAVKEVPGRNADSGDKLGMFRITPDCLRSFESPRAEQSEEDLLNEFESTLGEQKLNYPRRIVRAFHTALKVNDLSPLTVLSGLSGTGKSQLPRAYARFFGIHFLHVPVEPGWDSPQDLLGFYDFVAERYRPTDRARALGHFDSRFAAEIKIANERNWEQRMLIILLDEMNLARTEYYFSEFLSRLEMRGPRTFHSEETRADSQIAIDLPYGEGEHPKHLYVPHNVLWVGTLNEDETTQALSDKVLDRANSIRFAPPRPSTLREYSDAPTRGVEEAKSYLPYERWLGWSEGRATNDTAAGQIGEIEETLQTLAELMQNAGRGFAYRITQSIKAYIARYPGNDWREPMIDQINMRLLPKLAGAELSECYTQIEELKVLAADQLGDPDFAQALDDAAQNSEASQIFSWPGYTYEKEDN